MIGILPRFLVYKNKIVNKRTGKTYILPEELVNLLYLFPRIDLIPKEFINFLEKENIIGEIDELYLPFIKESKFNDERLFIQLTEKCNLYCKHCFVSAGWQKNEEYDLEKVKCLIDQAVELGICRIDFTGGEISTFSWIVNLIEYLEQKPIAYSFFSNLVIEDEKMLDALMLANGLKEIITSLDYFEDKKHDEFRGKEGAFRTTINNIRVLSDSGINISVNTMVLMDNHNDIISMIDYFYPLGIYMCLDTVLKKGRAKENDDFLDDYKAYVDFIIECNKYIRDTYGCKIDFWGTNKCGVGESLLYVDKNARFQLCPGLTEEDNGEFYLGDTIETAIEKRNKFDLTCEEVCAFHDRCSYGCREKAFVYSGNLKSREMALCYLLDKGL